MASRITASRAAKKAAFLQVGKDLERVLQAVTDIFQDIQEDYFYFLDHSENCLPSKLEKNTIFQQNIFEPLKELDLEFETNKSQVVLGNETPGIVESTQFPKKKKNLESSLQNNWNNSRKHILSTKSSLPNNKNNENQVPSTSTSAFDVISNTQQKSQLSGKLSLSKVNADTRISSGGKISRQTKLVLQPIVKKTDVSIREKNDKIFALNKHFDILDMDIDAKIFEKPFSMEDSLINPVADFDKKNDTLTSDIIEVSPVHTSVRKKGRLKLKRKSPAEDSIDSVHDVAMTADFNIDKINNYSTQLPALTPQKSINKKKKKEIASTSSPIAQIIGIPTTSNESQELLDFDIFSFETAPKFDETLFSENQTKTIDKKKKVVNILQNLKMNSEFSKISEDLDETYFSPPEELIAKKIEDKLEGPDCMKRKYQDIAGPSHAEKQDSKVIDDYDVGDGWDTDYSLDQWPTTPLKKKQFIDSFDHIPEKKKISPKFAYKGEVIRNKQERRKLRGWDCKECENWYQNMKLTDKELEMRKNQCSRHRSKFSERYYTPPGFWNPVFSEPMSSSQESISEN